MYDENKNIDHYVTKKKFFTLFLIFVLFPAIQVMAGGTYHLKVGDSQRVSFTPHDGILTHTIRWVSYSPYIAVSGIYRNDSYD